MSQNRKLNMLLAISSLIIAVPVEAQIMDDSIQITKGSYLHFGHAAIEDNSMYLEEAFNQGAGIIQFISGTVLIDETIETAFEIEIPLSGEKHQLSISTSYFSTGSHVTSAPNGFGDIRVSYRPLLSGKHRRVMIIPRFTVALPRKNSQDEFSYKPDAELALALTKRFSKTITSHFNIGASYRHRHIQNRMFNKFVAGSLVWALRPKINFMLESVYSGSTHEISESIHEVIINPAVRLSFQLNHYQIVPGMGFPLTFNQDSKTSGAFIYLSIEPF